MRESIVSFYTTGSRVRYRMYELIAAACAIYVILSRAVFSRPEQETAVFVGMMMAVLVAAAPLLRHVVPPLFFADIEWRDVSWWRTSLDILKHPPGEALGGIGGNSPRGYWGSGARAKRAAHAQAKKDRKGRSG